MKIQYNNSFEARIAYIECQTNTLPFVDFSEFADDPDFHIYPVFGDKMTNTLYTNRDFMVLTSIACLAYWGMRILPSRKGIWKA